MSAIIIILGICLIDLICCGIAKLFGIDVH